MLFMMYDLEVQAYSSAMFFELFKAQSSIRRNCHMVADDRVLRKNVFWEPLLESHDPASFKVREDSQL